MMRFVSLARPWLALGFLALLAPMTALAGPSVESDLVERIERPEAARALRPRPASVSLEHGREWIDVWITGAVDPREIERLGGTANTIVPGQMTAHLPVDALGQLVRTGGLERLQMAQPVEPQSDVSLPEVGAPAVWGGPPPTYPQTGFTGRGVVLGIVDTGIDPGHPDFRTSSGTRISWLWDQNFGQTPAPPAGFTYGSEYAPSAINAGQYTAGDVVGHGSHIAGVAAGNGRATGNGKPAYTYLGVAPEANLVIVRLRYNQDGSITDDKVVDGVKYVFAKAAAMGKPAVVLLAVAKTTGPHDGTDPLDASISALCGPGKIVCVSAGNYGGAARHAEWTSTAANQTGNMTVQVSSYVPASNAYDFFRSEAWYDGAANYSVSVVTPTGQVVGPIARGATTTVNTASGIVNIVNGQYVSSNGSYRVDLFVYRGSLSYPQVATGTWTYRFSSQASGTRRVDAWLTSYSLGATVPVYATGMTERCLVASPATGNGVIAVGAYSTKTSWTAVNGRSYYYPGAVLHGVASFSSPGPRRDGVMLPHVNAPGYGVAGAKSGQYYPSTSYLMPDSVHCIKYGTSVSAAHAAGSVALLLQQDPTLTPAEAAAALERNALSDSYTGAIPNASWGYGKLHMSTATLAAGVDDAPTLPFALAIVSGNPSRGGRAQFRFSISAQELAAGARDIRLRIIDVSGRSVASIAAQSKTGAQTVAWDGRNTEGLPAPAGVYMALLEVGARRSSTKFVRLH